MIQIKNREDKYTAGDLVKSWRKGKALGQLSSFVVYIAILIIAFYLGRGYFWAAFMGVAFKLLIDSMWGDLPFQGHKAPIK